MATSRVDALNTIKTRWQDEVQLFVRTFEEQAQNVPLEDILGKDIAEQNDLEIMENVYRHLLENPSLYFKSPFKYSHTQGSVLQHYLSILKTTLMTLLH